MLATAPAAGTEVIVGTTVRVNVSKGPKPIAVPNVVGSPFESAESILQGVGFAVARQKTSRTTPTPASSSVRIRPPARSRARAP